MCQVSAGWAPLARQGAAQRFALCRYRLLHLLSALVVAGGRKHCLLAGHGSCVTGQIPVSTGACTPLVCRTLVLSSLFCSVCPLRANFTQRLAAPDSKVKGRAGALPNRCSAVHVGMVRCGGQHIKQKSPARAHSNALETTCKRSCLSHSTVENNKTTGELAPNL